MPPAGGAGRDAPRTSMGISDCGPTQFGGCAFSFFLLFSFSFSFLFLLYLFWFSLFLFKFENCSDFKVCSNLKIVQISNFVQI
jgi:hypothetical protein